MIQNQSPVSTKPIFKTKVETSTMNSWVTETVDHHIVYISSITNNGKEIRVRPLSILNWECMEKSKKIFEDRVICGIEKKKNTGFLKNDGGIFITLGDAKVKQLKINDLHLYLEFDSKIIHLGKIKGVIPINVNQDESYNNYYKEFLRVAHLTLQNYSK